MNIRLFGKVGKQDSNLDLTQPAPSDPRPVPVRVCKLNITCFVILIMNDECQKQQSLPYYPLSNGDHIP